MYAQMHPNTAQSIGATNQRPASITSCFTYEPLFIHVVEDGVMSWGGMG